MVDKNGKKIIINERLRDTRDVVTCETPGQEYLQRGVVALPPARARPVQRRVVHQEVEAAGLHVPPRLGQEPLVAAAQPRLAVHGAQTVIRTPVPACGAVTDYCIIVQRQPGLTLLGLEPHLDEVHGHGDGELGGPRHAARREHGCVGGAGAGRSAHCAH